MTKRWYRNAGSGVYHMEGDNWIRSGKAACGRAIRRPGWVASNRKEVRALPGKRCCRDCDKSETREEQ